MFFSCKLSGVNSLNAIPKCISMSDQECKIIPGVIIINSNEPLFSPESTKVKKCSGSCNNINDL